MIPVRLSAGNKYHAKPVVVNGVRFDSKGEAARHAELLLMQDAGEIRNLQRQFAFALHAYGPRYGSQEVARYKADFVYERNGVIVVEDFKGHRTAMYRLKAKWMQAEYGITILETGR